ncbi:hypothetical protein EC847_11821 [Scandinavium goeteborgense]|uniref:Uncharacterized protein n=2 Tax=Scandinavium goeteborgense TaxID=1851514 RepID=A0A4V3BMP7_SCAGO|nr:hypothetical protein EC847_11821 [Scandinavium goeteborgense]
MFTGDIDDNIFTLVKTFYACGFRTFASLEKLVREDAESVSPDLLWGWSLTATFNSSGVLGFVLRATKPHCALCRYSRKTLNADISTLSEMLQLHVAGLRES